MEELYYIKSPYSCCGNCVSWWAIDGHGYTCDLGKAWKVNRKKAISTLSDKRGDEAFLVSEIDLMAVKHFDYQNIGVHVNAVSF